MSHENDLLVALLKKGFLNESQAQEAREMHSMMGQMGVKETLEEVLAKKFNVTPQQIEEAKKLASQKPELVPGYVEEGVLGHGRFGTVYKARQVSEDRRVAVKIIKTNLLRTPEDGERMLSEARKSLHLTHPALAELIDCGREKKTDYFVMEYVDGMTLRDTVLLSGPMSEKKAFVMASEIAQALGVLHHRHLMHRNLTPGNVIFTKEGKVKLTDFGMTPSVEVSKDVNEKGIAYGVAGWMAPEQIVALEDMDGRVDLYGLGAILYFALTGKTLFVGAGEKETTSRQLSDVPQDPRTYVPTLSSTAAGIVMKLLDRDRGKRYENVEALQKDIDVLMNPSLALQQAKVEGAKKGKQMALVGALAGLAAFGVVAFIMFKPAPIPTPNPPIVKETDPKDPDKPPVDPVKPPDPNPKDPKPVDKTPTDLEAPAKKLFADADKAVQEGRWEDGKRLFIELTQGYDSTQFVAERKDEIDQKFGLCKAKLNEIAEAKRQEQQKQAAEIAQEFKRIQTLIDAGKWTEAQEALAPLEAKVKNDDVAKQTLLAMKEKCDLEAQAVQTWEKIQTAVKDKKWSEVPDLLQDFKRVYERSQAYEANAAEAEQLKLKASREALAQAAVNDVRNKFKDLKFDEAKAAYKDLQEQHAETDAFKAAEAELKDLASGMDTEKKGKLEEEAKKALEDAHKLYDAKKWAEADAAYEKFLEDYKDTDTGKKAEETIKERREAMAKKVEGDREATARKEYTKIKSLFDKKSFEEGVPLMEKFQEKHGETDFAKSKKKEIEELMEKGQAAVARAKRSLIDDFENEDVSAWEAKGVRSDNTKIESVEGAKIGSRALSVHIPSHDENPKDGRWPRAQKHLTDEWSEDVTHMTFWAKGEKAGKITVQVHTGEKDSECIFIVEKAVGVDWTLVTVGLNEMKFVWSARRRTNVPKLDPTRITEVAFGLMNPGKSIDFTIDHVKIEEKK